MTESRHNNRCVIVGGADISCPGRVTAFLREGDFVICCDSGLRHAGVLGAPPDLIVGDFDSYEDPHSDIETIRLPVAKDDTDTVYAVREGIKRGFKDFLLIGAIGARLDHSLVNVYLLGMLRDNGCRGLIVDDYSEIELICAGDEPALVDSSYPYFSLVATEGIARGVSIKGAKFPLEDAEITPGYQYATSNEALPGETAEITVGEGRLLLIRILPGAAKRHPEEE